MANKGKVATAAIRQAPPPASPPGAQERERVAAMLQAGDAAGAEAAARLLAADNPYDVACLNLLGVAVKRQGRLKESMAVFQAMLVAMPYNRSAFQNLGNTLRAVGRPDEAATCFRRLSQLLPGDAEALRLLGGSLRAAGKPEAALAAVERALAVSPDDIGIAHDRALILYDLGRIEACSAAVSQGLAQVPEHRGFRTMQAVIARRESRFTDARSAYHALLADNPSDQEVWRLLGNLLNYSLGDHAGANAAFRRALALRPRDADTAARLCDSLMNSRHGPEGGFIDQAHELATDIVARYPMTPELADRLQVAFIRTADYLGVAGLGTFTDLTRKWAETGAVSGLHLQLGRVVSAQDRRHLVEMHRVWGAGTERQLPAPLVARGRGRPADRRIRVGLLSPDLRHHPVSYFVQPIAEFYDRAAIDLYCYSSSPRPADNVQRYFEQHSTQFRSLVGLPDREAAQVIAGDGIDVLVELAGSTKYNRLNLMLHRPAPVQVSWLGYPHSLGLSCIDRILVDPHLMPQDPALLVERPFAMPESWVTLGRVGFFDIEILPGLPQDRTGGRITFGTMNNPYKYNALLFGLWAQVLRAVPDSDFLFVRPEGGSAVFRRNVIAQFAQHGVEPGRIRFDPVRGKHMPHYNRIDIALDTAPQTGGTTTCETLWMGVPVVTLVGEAFFERLSYSNLVNAGLGDLCARTAEQYVAIAAALAEDRARRLDLRHGLRARIRSHPLGQAERWVRHFEDAVRASL